MNKSLNSLAENLYDNLIFIIGFLDITDYQKDVLIDKIDELIDVLLS